MKQINDFTLKKIDEMSGRELFCTERLREETFVTEQKITLPELDDQDLIAIQAYRLNDDQTNALATCRIFEEDGKWMLGRVAVSKAARGMHLGSKMVEAVQEYLREKGVAALYCHANAGWTVLCQIRLSRNRRAIWRSWHSAHHDEKGLELIEFFFNCGHNLVNQKSVTFIS